MNEGLQEKYTQYSDSDLLNFYKSNGDKKILGILLSRYTLLVYGVCLKYLKQSADAQDAAQQVFEKTIQEIDKYDIPFFKSWLYSVAKNHCLMHLRNSHTKFRSNFLYIDEFDLTDNSEDFPEESIFSINTDQLEKALLELNPEQSTCISLFYLRNKKYKEIEEITGMNFQQVKSHIQNGKRNLKIILEKQHWDYEK